MMEVVVIEIFLVNNKNMEILYRVEKRFCFFLNYMTLLLNLITYFLYLYFSKYNTWKYRQEIELVIAELPGLR